MHNMGAIDLHTRGGRLWREAVVLPSRNAVVPYGATRSLKPSGCEKHGICSEMPLVAVSVRRFLPRLEDPRMGLVADFLHQRQVVAAETG